MAEELPPVVARLVGDISDLEGSIETAEALLYSLVDVAGEVSSALGGAFAGVGGEIGHDITGSLIATLSGAGESAGSEILDGLDAQMSAGSSGAASAGEKIGESLTEGVAEGASALGDVLAGEINSGLSAGTPNMDALAQELTTRLGEIGTQAGGAFAATFGAAEAAALGSFGAGAGSAGGTLSALLTAALASRLPDAAAEVGSTAGDSLAAAMGTAGVQNAGRVAANFSAAVGALLDGSMAEAGGTGGDALAQAVATAAAQGADSVAGHFAEALQASLETTMAEAGGAAADALNAGMESGATSGGTAYVAEFAAGAETVAETEGAAVGAAFGRGLSNAALVGVDLLEANLSTQGRSLGPTGSSWVPHPNMNDALAEAQQAAAQDAQLLADSLAVDEEMVQNGIDNFLTLSEQGMRQWMAEVETAAQSSTSAFIDAYFAINEQLTATTSLTEQQTQALEYLYSEARAEMDALQAEAIAFNESIKTVSFTPSMSMNVPLGGYSESEFSALVANMPKASGSAAEVEGALSGVDKAAAGATASMGGMASMMTGPVGMGAMMLAGMLPMLSGAFSGASVSAADFTQSVQKDSGAVGDNTAATIQQALAKSNLSDISQQLGISQSTLIEYAAGESAAQQQVTAAVDAKAQSLQQASNAEGVHSKAENDSGNAADKAAAQLQDYKARLDAVTSAVQQAIQQNKDNTDALLAADKTAQIYDASVAALGSQMLLNAQQTNMQNKAIVDYTDQLLAAANADGAFNLALDASYDKMQLNAQASSQATVGLLNLGDNQDRANMLLYDSVDAYTQAQQGANAYGTILSSLNGSFTTLYGDEATFTGSLDSFTKSIDKNGTSLDANSSKGYLNAEAAKAVATAAQQTAQAVYQNDVQNGNASKAYQDATDKLQQEKQAFIDAADKAGANKNAVKELADQLFSLPPNITVDANIKPALYGLSELLNRVDSASGTITVYENTSGFVSSTQLPRGAGARASGGPVEAGQLYHVNESGAEGYFVPPVDGFVVPHDAMAALSSGGSRLGPAFNTAGGAGAIYMPITINTGALLGTDITIANAVQQAMGRLGMRLPAQYASIQSTRGR